MIVNLTAVMGSLTAVLFPTLRLGSITVVYLLCEIRKTWSLLLHLLSCLGLCHTWCSAIQLFRLRFPSFGK